MMDSIKLNQLTANWAVVECPLMAQSGHRVGDRIVLPFEIHAFNPDHIIAK